MGTRMSEECFNLGVRVHANNEAVRLHNKNKKIVTNHYMDLRFYVSMLFLLYYISNDNVCYLCLAYLIFLL
jgi:hypothetical protein